MDTGAAASSPVALPLNEINPGSFALALAAGLAAAVGGAILWAIVTIMTDYKIGIMAIAVGFLVGRAIIAVVKHGNGALGFLGAACSLSGCLLGNLLSAVGFAAQGAKISYFDLLTRLNPDLVVRLFTATFGAMDLIFYAIGIYEGYRFASRR
jgi:hypothetical protein